MGSGKSSVGRRLAQRLHWDFVDTDHLIESRENRAISDIFQDSGESYFRQIESAVICEMLQSPPKVISTGGGAILIPANLQMMLEMGHVICLSVTPEEAFERTKHHSHRPLLQTDNPLETIRELMGQRLALYNQAHYIVDTEGKSPLEIVDSIIKYIDQSSL